MDRGASDGQRVLMVAALVRGEEVVVHAPTAIERRAGAAAVAHLERDEWSCTARVEDGRRRRAAARKRGR